MKDEEGKEDLFYERENKLKKKIRRSYLYKASSISIESAAMMQCDFLKLEGLPKKKKSYIVCNFIVCHLSPPDTHSSVELKKYKRAMLYRSHSGHQEAYRTQHLGN